MDQVTVCFTSKSPFGARETELPARHTKTQVRPDNARTLPCAHSRSASGLSPLSISAADIGRGISFSRIVKVRRTVSLQRCASKQVSSEFKRSATMIALPRNFRVTDTVMTPSALFCCFYPFCFIVWTVLQVCISGKERLFSAYWATTVLRCPTDRLIRDVCVFVL